MLLCAQAFTLQSRQNHGLQLFCATSFARFPASAKTCYDPHPHKPSLFCPLSPEAYLLTGKIWVATPLSGEAEERGVQRSADGVSRRLRLIEQVSAPVSPGVPQIFRIFISTAARLSFQKTTGLFG